VLQPGVDVLPARLEMVLLDINLLCRSLVVAWAFDAARRRGNLALGAAACAAALGCVGAAFLHMAGPEAWEWLSAVWAGVALLSLLPAELLHRRLLALEDAEDGAEAGRLRAVCLPITYTALGILGLAAVGSLLAFPLAVRVAGGLGLAGLLALSVLRRQPTIRVPAMLLANWQILALVVLLQVPGRRFLFDLTAADLPALLLPLACGMAASALVWQGLKAQLTDRWAYLAVGHLWALRALTVVALVRSLGLPGLTETDAAAAVGAFALLFLGEVWAACVRGAEERAWLAEAVAGAGVGYLFHFGVLTCQSGAWMFVVLGVALVLWIGRAAAVHSPRLAALARPLSLTAFALPLAAVSMGVYRHVQFGAADWRGANSLALLLAAGFYFWRGLEDGRKGLVLLAGVIVNVALALLWRDLAWTDPQFFMIPLGVTALALVQLFRAELPARFVNPLRYVGALVILVSPTFHIVGGSWVHLFTLMVASAGIVLLAIGLRVRALMYAGTAFLLADLAAMVVHGSMADVNVLWMSGLSLGAGLLTLGAVCERNRETLLLRMQVLAETLKAWE
jgi:hypothetical protein